MRKLEIRDYVRDEMARGATREEAIDNVAHDMGVSVGFVITRCRVEKKRAHAKSRRTE